MNQMHECADACQNDMICVNQCFLTLGENNELCPCGKFCESMDYFDYLYYHFFHRVFFNIC